MSLWKQINKDMKVIFKKYLHWQGCSKLGYLLADGQALFANPGQPLAEWVAETFLGA
jgi:hypothetical protein